MQARPRDWSRRGGGFGRRRLLGALGAALPLAVLAACGAPAASPTTAPPVSAPTKPAAAATTAPAAAAPTTAPAAAPTTAAAATKPATGATLELKLATDWNTPARKAVLDLMKSQFEAANPNVKIEHWHMGSGGTSGPGGYTDVIVAQLLTRSGADAIANFSWGPHATHLIDLTRDAPAAGWKKEEMYFDEPNQTLDGKLYMLSMSASVTNWVYNKTIFKEAGLKEPDDTWTFDTVLEAAQKLTDPAKKQYGLFTPNQFERGYVDGMLAGGAGATSATTAEVFNLEQKKTRLGEAGGPDHFAWYIDAIYKHKVAPAPGEVPSLASGGITNPFAAGRIAMQPFGLYAAGDAVQQIGTRFEWAGMPTPKHQVTGNRATVLISEGFVLPKYTQARGTYETALKYALSFYGDPVMKAVAAGRGTLPVVRKWIKSTEYLNPPPGSMDIIVKTVEDPKIVMGNFNWNTKAWGPWRQAVRTELDRAFANDRPARDALAAAIKAGDEALAKS